jgi:hypothetical protein
MESHLKPSQHVHNEPKTVLYRSDQIPRHPLKAHV